MHFKIPSAICFNLDQSKILSSGYGLSLLFTVHCPWSDPGLHPQSYKAYSTRRVDTHTITILVYVLLLHLLVYLHLSLP